MADAWHFDNAAKAIGIAILFDGIDGRIARMTHTTSDFGRELDSLADVITFGVAPAVLAWMWGFRWLPTSLDLNGLVDMPASDFRARVITGFCPVISASSRVAESSSLAFWIASPSPMFTTILRRRGTAIAFR